MPAGLSALAQPPSLASCSRDHYPQPGRWTLLEAVQIARATASVLSHLHARGLMHGDFYAHNLMWAPGQPVMLGDFGAATPFDVADTRLAQACRRIDQRAWGCLVDELLQHLPTDQALRQDAWSAQARAALSHWREVGMGLVAHRPEWADVLASLDAVIAAA